jgi:aryl-alcohol dehydrogenase-like predicted oxidoreductase
MRDSTKLVEAAIELGIRHFDVAPPYGLGLAEKVLGEVLSSRWDSFTIATKVGIGRPGRPHALAIARKIMRPLAKVMPRLRRMMRLAVHSTNARRRFRFTAAEVQLSFTDSRRFLRTDCVDILMLHEPRPEDVTPELIHMFERLVTQGEVKLVGSGTGDTFEKLVKFGKVSQYRWDPMTQVTRRSDEQHIQHGALRYGLAALPSAMKARPKQTQELSALLGCDLTDPANLPAMLATMALATDQRSILLVSSNDISRLRSCVRGINWSVARGEQPGIERALQRLLCAPIAAFAN